MLCCERLEPFELPLDGPLEQQCNPFPQLLACFMRTTLRAGDMPTAQEHGASFLVRPGYSRAERRVPR